MDIKNILVTLMVLQNIYHDTIEQDNHGIMRQTSRGTVMGQSAIPWYYYNLVAKHDIIIHQLPIIASIHVSIVYFCHR